MTTLTIREGENEGGWGDFEPAEVVRSIDELRPGDVLLQRTRKPGFSRPCQHVLEIIGGDPTGGCRPLVRARLLDPARPAATGAWVVLWDFCLSEGRAEWYRARRG